MYVKTEICNIKILVCTSVLVYLQKLSANSYKYFYKSQDINSKFLIKETLHLDV